MNEKTDAVEDSRSILAAKLIAHRTKLGLSQEAFADSIGLHRTYIGRLEKGLHATSLDTLDRLARFLGVAPYQLLKPTRKRPSKAADAMEG